MKNRARSLVRIGFLMLFLALLIPGTAQAKKTAKKKTDSYIIKINKLQNTVTVYKKRKAIKAFPCSTWPYNADGNLSDSAADALACAQRTLLWTILQPYL